MAAERRVLLALVAALAMQGVIAAPAASSSSNGLSLAQAQAMAPRYRSDKDRARAAQQDARASIVRDAALVVGTQGGYAERAAEIGEIVVARSTYLDRIWNFGPLVESGRLLVPAVQFTQREQVLKGELRETDRVLRVTEPARLVTMPPTWRDWLIPLQVEPPQPDDAALPQSEDERKTWRAAVADGWEVGRAQAQAVFLTQLELLTAAYTDRLRYRELVAQKMLVPSALGRTDLGIVRADDVVRIEDSIYAVRQAARFAEPQQWRPVVRPAAASEAHR